MSGECAFTWANGWGEHSCVRDVHGPIDGSRVVWHHCDCDADQYLTPKEEER